MFGPGSVDVFANQQKACLLALEEICFTMHNLLDDKARTALKDETLFMLSPGSRAGFEGRAPSGVREARKLNPTMVDRGFANESHCIAELNFVRMDMFDPAAPINLVSTPTDEKLDWDTERLFGLQAFNALMQVKGATSFQVYPDYAQHKQPTKPLLFDSVAVTAACLPETADKARQSLLTRPELTPRTRTSKDQATARASHPSLFVSNLDAAVLANHETDLPGLFAQGSNEAKSVRVICLLLMFTQIVLRFFSSMCLSSVAVLTVFLFLFFRL